MRRLIILSSIILLTLSLSNCLFHRLDDRGLVRIVTIEQTNSEQTKVSFMSTFIGEWNRLIEDGYVIKDWYIDWDDFPWEAIIICRRK